MCAVKIKYVYANFFLIHQGDKRPVVMHNKGATVVKGNLVQLSSEQLISSIQEGDSGSLVYTLTPPANNPQEGKQACLSDCKIHGQSDEQTRVFILYMAYIDD